VESEFIKNWRQAAATKDAKALAAFLAPGFRLVSPVSFKPYEHPGEVQKIFGAILKVLPDLTYTRCEPFKGGAMMIFEGTIGGESPVKVEGIDIFTLDQAGRATELKVFVRPLKATNAFAEAMKVQLTPS